MKRQKYATWQTIVATPVKKGGEIFDFIQKNIFCSFKLNVARTLHVRYIFINDLIGLEK